MTPPAPAAVLWDMDGLLIDTEPLWTTAQHELAARLGGRMTRELKAAMVGTRLDTAVPLMLRSFDQPTDDDTVARTSLWLLDAMVELFRRPLVLMPGALALLHALREAAVPVALVSSSYRVLVDAVLAQGQVRFDVSVAGDEVRAGKPQPEPYLRAAAALGVDPAACVVLEDSPAGAASGTAAGCAVVAVPDVPGVRFAPAPRQVQVASLGEVDLTLLARLLQAEQG